MIYNLTQKDWFCLAFLHIKSFFSLVVRTTLRSHIFWTLVNHSDDSTRKKSLDSRYWRTSTFLMASVMLFSPRQSLFLISKFPSIDGNGLSTSVYYNPTDSHSYLLHSSSDPSQVKSSIQFSHDQFLKLRLLCSDDSHFSNKSEEMCQFFKRRGYPGNTAQHRDQ